MASTYVAFGASEDSHKKHSIVSPKNIKRTWSSSTSPTYSHGGGAAPKCVCAPATHAGSFKCRLHRVNSHGHSPPSPTLPPQPVASAPSSKTVEAQ